MQENELLGSANFRSLLSKKAPSLCRTSEEKVLKFLHFILWKEKKNKQEEIKNLTQSLCLAHTYYSRLAF